MKIETVEFPDEGKREILISIKINEIPDWDIIKATIEGHILEYDYPG